MRVTACVLVYVCVCACMWVCKSWCKSVCVGVCECSGFVRHSVSACGCVCGCVNHGVSACNCVYVGVCVRGCWCVFFSNSSVRLD